MIKPSNLQLQPLLFKFVVRRMVHLRQPVVDYRSNLKRNSYISIKFISNDGRIRKKEKYS